MCTPANVHLDAGRSKNNMSPHREINMSGRWVHWSHTSQVVGLLFTLLQCTWTWILSVMAAGWPLDNNKTHDDGPTLNQHWVSVSCWLGWSTTSTIDSPTFVISKISPQCTLDDGSTVILYHMLFCSNYLHIIIPILRSDLWLMFVCRHHLSRCILASVHIF